MNRTDSTTGTPAEEGMANAEGTPDRVEPWYESWFGEEYLEIYPHRDEDEARRAVALFREQAGVSGGGAILDLACGAGRHLRAMRDAGFHPVGLDLSMPLLRSARSDTPTERIVRADMRCLPFAPGTFHAVTSFFTSIGYFEDDTDDARLLAEVRRVLRGTGTLLLDFLNADWVRANLRPRDERMAGGRRVVQERRLVDGGRAVHKTIRLAATAESPARVFHERVRLYSAGELGELLSTRGFEPTHWFGDYRGSALDPAAPRVIIVAHATP